MDKIKFFFFGILLIGCTNTKSISDDQNKNSKNATQVPQLEVILYVDVLNDGNYVLQDSLEVPEPKQGKIPFLKTMYSNMLYPSEARDKGIQGNVVLGVSVDINGNVTNVSIVRSDHTLLERSALKAFEHAETEGYNPLTIDGNTVPYKFEMPVRFMLH